MADTYTFTLNRDQVIKGALKKVGAIGQGEDPNTDQVTEAAESLNILVKAWQADGLPLWRIKKDFFDLSAGQAKYSTDTSFGLDAKPMKIMQVYLHDINSGSDIELVTVSRMEYNRLGKKDAQGYPTQYYYDIQNTHGELNLYPVPNTDAQLNKQLAIIYQEQVKDILVSTDVPDFPSEWNRALVYGLACDIADDYGVPLKERAYLQQRATLLKAEVLSWDQEDASVFFTKEVRGGM
jgi:hypothetical protein